MCSISIQRSTCNLQEYLFYTCSTCVCVNVCVCADEPNDTVYSVYAAIRKVLPSCHCHFCPLFCNLVSCFAFRWRVVCQSTEENRAQTSSRLNVAILSRGWDATKAGIQQIAEIAWLLVFSYKNRQSDTVKLTFDNLCFVGVCNRLSAVDSHHISCRSNPFPNDWKIMGRLKLQVQTQNSATLGERKIAAILCVGATAQNFDDSQRCVGCVGFWSQWWWESWMVRKLWNHS